LLNFVFCKQATTHNEVLAKGSTVNTKKIIIINNITLVSQANLGIFLDLQLQPR
jgi:hypothetical protein